MTPLERYQILIRSGELHPDDSQLKIISRLEKIYQALEKNKKDKQHFLKRFKKPAIIKGLYLWGGVGIGKTRMMDIFFNCVSVGKLRMHFHQFMQKVHQELNEIQGHKNPLVFIAKNLSKNTSVICFDEFFVTNITDAMLLGELFTTLFSQGVTLIASSNITPDLLYKDGLQRERFLPAIAQIKQHCDILYVPTTTDYRLQKIKKAGVFYTPLNHESHEHMENCFSHFSHGAPVNEFPIAINGRQIPVIKTASNVAWFEFNTLCGKPRCQRDYLTIAEQFHTVLLSNLHAIPASDKNTITLFIYLIDILYDANCRLIISSSVSIESIYIAGELLSAFNRTKSRLIEMQSDGYLHNSFQDKALTPL